MICRQKRDGMSKSILVYFKFVCGWCKRPGEKAMCDECRKEQEDWEEKQLQSNGV